MTLEEWIKYTEKNIMFKQDVQEYIKNSDGTKPWPHGSFQQAVESGRLKPILVRGEGTAMIRIFLRSDVEEYKKGVEDRRKRLKK